MKLGFKDGKVYGVALREGKEKEKYFIHDGNIMAIKEPLHYGKDIYFISLEHEYTADLINKENSKLDIMKVFDLFGNLIWDREKEESKVDWTKVKLGTDVEYLTPSRKWEKAKFVLFESASKTILMTDGKKLICNYTEDVVRLANSQDKKKEEADVECINTPFGTVKLTKGDVDDLFDSIINGLNF